MGARFSHGGRGVHPKIPKLDLDRVQNVETMEGEEVPYKGIWLRGRVKSIDENSLMAELSFEGTIVVMKVRNSEGSLEGIELEDLNFMPVSWGTSGSIVANISKLSNKCEESQNLL